MTLLQFPLAATETPVPVPEEIRGAVFRYPGEPTHRNKPRYGFIVFRKTHKHTRIMLSGQGEWGVCLAIALAEVKRLREAGEFPGVTGQGVVGVPQEYGLSHPIISYKSKDKILGEVRGFQTVHEALVWLRKEE